MECDFKKIVVHSVMKLIRGDESMEKNSELYTIACHLVCEDAKEDALKGLVRTDEEVNEETNRIYRQLLLNKNH